jgi:hypothetical protein
MFSVCTPAKNSLLLERTSCQRDEQIRRYILSEINFSETYFIIIFIGFPKPSYFLLHMLPLLTFLCFLE